MTRLSPTPVPTGEAHAVVTLPDVHASAKIIWLFIRSVADPQRRIDLAEALGLDGQTVTRSLRALAKHGLVRQVNGVWLPMSPRGDQ